MSDTTRDDRELLNNLSALIDAARSTGEIACDSATALQRRGRTLEQLARTLDAARTRVIQDPGFRPQAEGLLEAGINAYDWQSSEVDRLIGRIP